MWDNLKKNLTAFAVDCINMKLISDVGLFFKGASAHAQALLEQ